MHYYPELKNPNVSNLAPYVWQEKNEKILLAEDGLYKYIDDALYKYKIISPNNSEIQPFVLEDVAIFPVDFRVQKKERTAQIPFNHCVMDLYKKRYKLNEKASTIFTVEYDDKAMRDYYFESEEACDNHSLREDILSFLSLLK